MIMMTRRRSFSDRHPACRPEKVGEEVVEAQQVRIIGDDWDGDRHAIEDTEML
jgi:hypothetical protein